ncbi:MAG: hypothetical protein ACETVR_00405 [Candidatus Bathyarchaeia archaeon]
MRCAKSGVDCSDCKKRDECTIYRKYVAELRFRPFYVEQVERPPLPYSIGWPESWPVPRVTR